jgi:hypothetical protein
MQQSLCDVTSKQFFTISPPANFPMTRQLNATSQNSFHRLFLGAKNQNIFKKTFVGLSMFELEKVILFSELSRIILVAA